MPLTLLLAILKLSLIDNVIFLMRCRSRSNLRKFTLTVHHTLDNISVIMRAVVEKDGAQTVRPVIAEVTLDKNNDCEILQ